jgi:hypothetical protein
VNTSLKKINLRDNGIGAEGASALADALKVNTSLTIIDFANNGIGNEGALAITDALKVTTSVTKIDLDYNGIDKSLLTNVDKLSLMCADECGVVWPYLLDVDDENVGVATDNVETLRAEFAAVVEERRRRAVTAARLVAADVVKGGSPAVKRRRTNR